MKTSAILIQVSLSAIQVST